MAKTPELWEECAAWLSKAGVLEFSNLHLNELGAALKDGVRLCKLANFLKEGCISHYRQIYSSQGSEFTREQNVLLFLDALKNGFGFAENELFEAIDLAQCEGFKKVINTLSRLSHTREAVNRGLRPFPDSLSPTSFPSSSSSEDIYCNLQNQIESVDENIYGACFYNNDTEDIYDKIVTRPQGKSTFEKFVPSSKREFQIKELLETETNYLKNCLEMLINDFYRPMKTCLSADHYKKIFRNILDIYTLHSSFHQHLQTAVHEALGITRRNSRNSQEEGGGGGDDKEVMGIGEVFTKHQTEFLKYAEYCAFMEDSRETLDEVEKTESSARKRIQELLKASKSDFRLQDLLSVPFQRLCKYHLLLQNIVDSTDVQNMERERLISGLNSCKEVVDYVNEAKRDFDNKKIIAHIDRSIIESEGGNFYSFGRFKQIDGLVKLTDSSENPVKAKQRFVFLFERVILICKKQKNSVYYYKNSYNFKNYVIQDTQTESPAATTRPNSTLTRLKSAARFDFFTLTLTSTVDDHKIQIDFKSMDQKRKWKEEILDSINKCTPPEGIAKQHQLTYNSYDSPTKCDACHKYLKGLFFQGYHCSRCNRNLHFECIKDAYCGRRTRSTPSRAIDFRPETYIAIETIRSQDPEVLSFDMHDEILIFDEMANGTLIGRCARLPGPSGLVSRNSVRPMSSLLKRTSTTSQENGANGNDAAEAPASIYPPPLTSKVICEVRSADLDVQVYPWYFGCKERIQANDILRGSPNGTFILRLSGRENKFVISISYEGLCKHMKIECETSEEKGKEYFLHDQMKFSTIPELINYYHSHSLDEGFDKIHTKLEQTVLKTRVFKVLAKYSIQHESTTPYLSLNRGDKITLIETNGEERGWWKFRTTSGQIGFFPLSYVEVDNGAATGQQEINENIQTANQISQTPLLANGP